MPDAVSSGPFRYVSEEGRNCISAFRSTKFGCTLVQTVRSQAPSALAVHPHRPVLYATNAVSLHDALPQGTVEVYSINRSNGLLCLWQRQTLSLSGTEPRSLAISPDQRFLLVALYGGGAYNVLPIEPNGTVGAPRRIFKELGGGLHPRWQASAHTHSLL